MSATIARQGGHVQLEQSNVHLALNMAKMAKGGLLRSAIKETQQRIKKPRFKVREEMCGGVIPWHNQVKAAIERHPAMVYKNLTDSCLPYQHGTAKNPQTRWRHKGPGTPPPEPVAPPPRRPPAPPGYTD
jgi:hypothetical protein